MNIIEVSYYSDSQNFRQDPTEKLIGMDIYFKFEWFQMIYNRLSSEIVSVAFIFIVEGAIIMVFQCQALQAAYVFVQLMQLIVIESNIVKHEIS